MQVSVVYAPQPRQLEEITLTLAEPCCVLDALHCSGLLEKYPDINPSTCLVGIWGRPVSLRQILRQHDRIEIYRPLRVDPKVARRERFAKQGARAAGLFVKKRLGAKAGY